MAPTTRRWPAHVLQVGVPSAVAGRLAAQGRTTGAIALVGFAVVLLAVRLATHGRADALIGRVAAALGRAVTSILVALVYLVVVIPTWAVRRAVGGARWGDPNGWSTPQANPPRSTRAPFAREVRRAPSGAARTASRWCTLVGAVVVVMAFDAGLGTVVEHLSTEPTASQLLPPAFAGARGTRVELIDPRAPALSHETWAAGHVRDLRSLTYEYWPLLAYHARAIASPTVTTDGWVRRSWRPSGDGPRPLVALFGGSMAFGTGQRDDHTIASALARLAAAEGLAIDVEDDGQPGWTMWQSWLRFEQASAGSRRPAVAAFLAGPDEARAERPAPTVPSHVGFGLFESRFLRSTTPASSAERVVLDAYLERSLIRRAWVGLFGGRSAGAATLPTAGIAPSTSEVIDVYRRGVVLAGAAARSRGVRTVFAWEPMARRDAEARAAAAGSVGSGLDLSRLLDHRPDLFLPDGSVDEAGARLVAAALWPSIRPTVVAWYRTHR